MVPQTFPSVFATSNGKTAMVVYAITDTTGLTRWVDYIPVKSSPDTDTINSYNNDGTLMVSQIFSTTGLQAGKDYIRVYEDASATKRWVISSDGFIPVYKLSDYIYDNLSLEDGDNVLLENGELFLLEG
jgi:hypothetical protein